MEDDSEDTIDGMELSLKSELYKVRHSQDNHHLESFMKNVMKGLHVRTNGLQITIHSTIL